MNSKKIINYFGNIVTISIIYFIIKRLISFDINWSLLLTPKNAINLLFLTATYGTIVYFSCIPWKNILQIISSKKIKFNIAAFIFCKSNLLKYIPGNIFQYLGRNEIALKMNISHIDAGISTVLDVFINLSAMFVVVIILYSTGLKIFIDNYGFDIIKFLLIIFTLIFSVFIIVYAILKNQIINYFNKFKVFIIKKNMKTLFLIISYSIFQSFLCGVIYLIIISTIVGESIITSNINIVIGSFILSNIIGFIFIGAPAGIGIREAAMVLLSGNLISSEHILISMLIYRIVNTIGDLLAVIIAKIISMLTKNL